MYEDTGSARCRDCIQANYCRGGQVVQPCAAGYVCQSGLNTSPDPPLGECSEGRYCPKGVQAEIRCPYETMSTTTGNEQQSDCTGCQPGWVCKWGSSDPYICPAGSYCPVLAGYKIIYKDYEYKCPKGTYNKLEGRVYEYECTECDEGYYCDEKGLVDVDDRECPTGHFCPKGTADPWECLPGTYQPQTGGSEEEDCTPCPKGSYCPQGSSNPDHASMATIAHPKQQ